MKFMGMIKFVTYIKANLFGSFHLFRYLGKNKTLMYDVTKIIATLKRRRGDHRTFRLAENLCINLLLSLKEFFAAKKEGKVCIVP